MADFSISGKMKVKTVRANFKKEFGSTLRLYSGAKFADDDALISSIAKKKVDTGSEVKANGNMKVGNFEKQLEDVFGIKAQIADPSDKTLVDNDLTLKASAK